MTDPLLDVRELERHYPITRGVLNREVGRVRAVDGISFTVDRGETFGLVGESGCGKSTAATTVLHLEEPTGGTVYFDGRPVGEHDAAERKRFRRRTAMVFQDPDSSFNPRRSVGESIAEPMAIHGLDDRARRTELVSELLSRVGLDPADAKRYPHEFSGGQKQRLALARALSVDPDLLIADEPVSALDVSVQAEILSLLDGLQEEFGLSVVFISHDLGVVREVCNRVGVMYLGELVETGPTEALFDEPSHPYTRALLDAIPTPDPTRERDRETLSGDVPDPSNPPAGCRFHTRCPDVIQPDGVEIDQSEWRSIVELTAGLRSGDVGTGRNRDDSSSSSDRAGSFDRSSRRGDESGRSDPIETLRDAYDLPREFEEERVENVVSEALEDAVSGDGEAAAERLETDLPTPCRRDAPEPYRCGDRHVASCHLLDERSSDGEPTDRED